MVRKIFTLMRPIQVTLAALSYLLGVSISNYLGISFKMDSFWLGLVICLLAQSSMSLLVEVFRPINEPIFENETRTQRVKLRILLLNISIGLLGMAAILAYVLFAQARLPVSALLFLIISLTLIIAYSVPPLRMLNRGFGELVVSAHIAYIIPSVGFLLQSESYHKLLFAIALPLTALGLAYFLVLDFPSFPSDQKYQRATLLRSLSWQRAVPLHHSLVIASYVLFLAASTLGPSLSLLWPAFLTFPFACLQIALLRNIALGAKPNWKLLTSTAVGVFGMTMYFLSLTFWLR